MSRTTGRTGARAKKGLAEEKRAVMQRRSLTRAERRAQTHSARTAAAAHAHQRATALSSLRDSPRRLPQRVLLVALLALGIAGEAIAADARRGQQLYEARCGGCHSIEADRIGPRHAGLLGRKAGSAEGFEYSPALRAAAFVWDEQRLDRWLADPEALVPGQRMNVGVADARDRADLIAYLRRVSRR